MGQHNGRLRFTLRSLLAAAAIVALLCWGWLELERWRAYARTTRLQDAVNSFNAAATADPVGRLEPKLTVCEVLASIQRQLPMLADHGEPVASIYARIMKTKRLPAASSIYSNNGYARRVGPTKTVWWINLDVVTGPNAGFALRIRENDSPAAASTAANLGR